MVERHDAAPIRLLAAVVVVITLTGLALTHQDRWLTVPVALVAAVVLVVLARRSGLSWDAMGLGRASLKSGVIWGAAASALVALGYLVVAVLPVGGAVFDDDAMPTSTLEAVARVLVVIPLRTVLIEELAFRGVLWGMLERRWGPQRATWWAAAAFGLWHVPAGLRLVESNEAIATMAPGSWLVTVLVVAVVVAVTAAAGVVFSELRRRSGSLAAPMLLHWVLNSAGTVLSFVR